ncbi:DUF7507 domain-containing protein, partial [Brucella endophytica]|uniref:DUF7507 domain-containing protein n=1 Tax=Brucella endophytica TaxID=1963359 RepID=UPI0035BC11B2
MFHIALLPTMVRRFKPAIAKRAFMPAMAMLTVSAALVGFSNSEARAQAAQPTFPACAPTIYFGQDGATQLVSTDTTTTPFTLTPIGGPNSLGYNAMAYDPSTNYIYATRWDASAGAYKLLRVGADGSVQDLGVIGGGGINAGGGLLNGSGIASGEIGADGYFYLKHNSTSNQMFRVDLSTRTATLITMSRSFASGDWAWHNGFLYAHDQVTGILNAVNPRTGAVTQIGNTGLSGADAFGSMIGATNGVFGRNNNGGFYQFDVNTGAATLISNMAAAGGDGAKCVNSPVNLPVDLSITKDDGVTVYTPGLDASYTIVVTNNGSHGVTGAKVSDPLPAGFTGTWTCGNATGGAVCGAPSGTGSLNTTADLPAGSSVTYAFSTGIPSSYSGALTNTATVTAPDGVTDTNPGNNSASDTNTMAPPPVSGACSPREITPGATFSFAPLGITGQVTKTGSPTGWDPAWTTMGRDYSITWTFAQPIPANWIQFAVWDVGGRNTYTATTLPSIRVTVSGGTATTADFSLVPGGYSTLYADMAYNASTGAFRYIPRSDEMKAAGTLRGNSADTVRTLTITATGILAGDYIGNSLYARPACITMEKVSQNGTGSFNFNMSNVVQANGTAVPSATLTTTTPGTAVSTPAYNARPGANMVLSEVIPAGWSVSSAVCTDRNAGGTGNPTVIGSFTSPALTIPAASVRPQADILCRFTNTTATDLAITKDDGAAEYGPGTDVTYNITVTNNGPTAVTDAVIRDPLSAGITTASWTCGNATGGAVCRAPSGTGAMSTTADLPAGASLTYQMTMSVPADFTGDLVNTATVAPPAGLTDSDPSNNSATDTNKAGAPKVRVKKELIGESVTTNNIAEPGEVLTYKVTITHESGIAFKDFDFIENIPNGATMTRVSGADGFTAPVAGASTVQLRVPEVPVGGVAEVEIDLTVAAPIPLGVSQIRNLVSGGDVPADCADCSVATPTPPYSPVSPPTISCSTTGAYFNTAFNGSGGMKASGSDDYWQVALTAANVTTPPATLSYGAATVVSAPPANYIKSPFGNANWIAHQANGGHTGNVDVFYRYQFNLDPGVDPKSLALAMNYYSDNSVYQVWVNGVAQNIRSRYGSADPYFYAGFAANGVASGILNKDWKTGLNTIIVHVKSGPGAQAFMAQITSDSICQPKLTLRKEVINDGEGTATPANFTLTATGKSPLTNAIQGPMGDTAVTNASIPAGTYTLAEVNQPGYVASAYSCAVDGGASTVLANNELTLANGQNAICTIVNDDQNPSLTIDKTGAFKNDRDGDGFVDAGDTITYSFLVKNTGNVPLTDVTVKDDLLARAGLTVTPGPQTLQPDAEITFTATYTALQDDIEAGQVTNTATAVGTPPFGDPIESEPDTLVMPPDSQPVVKVKKELINESINANNVAEAGEVLTYRVTLTHVSGASFKDFDFIENIPNGATMTRVSGADGFTDPVAGASTVQLRVPEVPAGGTVEVEIDLMVAAPVPLGISQIRNLVSGGDVPPDCTECSVDLPTPPYTPQFPETISCTTPGAFFNTAYNGAGGAKPSGFDTYWQVAYNTNGTLPASSAYGAATVVSNPNSGWATSPYSNARWIARSATGTPNGPYDAYYRYQFNLDAAVDPSSLSLKMNYYADDNVVQVYVNGAAQGISATSAYATGRGASGTLNKNFKTGLNEIIVHTLNTGGVGGFMAQIDAGNICQPKITLRKEVINDQKGTAVPTDFTLRATGKSPLTKVIVGKMGEPAVTNASVPAGTFILGEDNQPGYLASTYSCAVDGGAETILTNSELTLVNGQNAICTIINNDQAPELKLEKTGKLNDRNGNDLIDLGETINYSFRVENVGDVPLTNVTVNDDLLARAGISVTPGPQTIQPGGVVTFTATYTPTQADINAGSVVNTATATGTPPVGDPVPSNPSTATVPPDQTPGLTIDKEGVLNDKDGDGLIDLGETISYTFLVTNTGTVTLTDVTVNDPLVEVEEDPVTLAPKGTFTFHGSYTPTQEDINKGNVVNTAHATGTPPSGPAIDSDPDTKIVPPDQTPRLIIDKVGTLNDTDGDGVIDPGETVNYSFTVTNTGTVTMSNVTVDDPKLKAAGLTVLETPQTLTPGQSFTFTLSGSYEPEQSEIDANLVINTATATGNTPSGTFYRSNPDSEQVPPDQTPGFSIDKIGKLNDLDGDDKIDLGETISYSFIVRNTGAVTLNNVTVEDTLLANRGIAIDPGPQTLAPGGVVTFTATYEPDQADIDKGDVVNTAKAIGTTPSGTSVESDPDTETVPPQQTPGLTIDKVGELNDTDNDGKVGPGETVDYTFTVTNTGMVTMTDVTVDDPKLKAAGLTVLEAPQTLSPGQSFTFHLSGSYQPGQTEIDANLIVNTATATGTTPQGSPFRSDPDTETVPPAQNAGLLIDKIGKLNDLDGDNKIDPGETVSYSFRVTNIGAVTLDNVMVDDPKLTVVGVTIVEGPQTLAPGASFVFTATEYTPVQGEIDAGEVKNTATARGVTPSGDPVVSNPDEETVPPDQSAALTIDKEGLLNDKDGDNKIDPDETITYTFTVRNTGNVTLVGVTVKDDLLAARSISVTPGPQTLAPGGQVVFTAVYTPEQADIEGEFVKNTATATGSDPEGNLIESPEDTAQVPPDRTPGITIDKTGTLQDKDGDGLIDEGEDITYTFLVTNTGNVTLKNVTVDDPLVKVVEEPQTLLPGGTFTFHGSYTPVQADIDAGNVKNTAHAVGTVPSGDTVRSEPDSYTVPPDQTPGLVLEKQGTLNDSNGNKLLDLGETISYTFTVTNAGKVTLSNVTIDDPLVTVVEGPQVLGPRGTFVFHGTYTPVQADIDAGKVLNTAVAKGVTPANTPVESEPDSFEVTANITPGLTIKKSGVLNDNDGDNRIDLGETISYSFLVTNTGTVTLNNVTVADTLLADRDIAVTPGPQTIAPGGSVTFTALYPPTQADVDAGDVVNMATATGTTPTGTPVKSNEDRATVPPDQMPRLTIDKVGTLNDLDGDNVIDPGETVDYIFKVTNTGTVTMNNVTVNDPKLVAAGLTVIESSRTLAPGESFTFHLSRSYEPSQAEIDAGKVVNTATATGTTPSGTPYESNPDTEQVPPDQVSGLTIKKSGVLNDNDGDDHIDLGETISYSFLVTNTGAVTLSNVTVDDTLLADRSITVTPGPQTIAPGGSVTFTAVYPPSQADVDAGDVVNMATATGTTPTGTPVESNEDRATVPPDQMPRLTIDKVGTLNDLDGDNVIDTGETVDYTFKVTNTGTVTMNNVTVNDPKLVAAGLTVIESSRTLAPGESFTFHLSRSYEPSQAEIDAGKVVNTATATGTTPSGTPYESNPDTEQVPPDQVSGLTIKKSGVLNDNDGDDQIDIGETISYSFLVTNTGAVTLSNVTVDDTLLADRSITVTPGPQTIAPGGSVTFTAVYPPSQADVDAGDVVNMATATGTTPTGTPVESNEDRATVPPDQMPRLTIDKVGTLNDLDGDNVIDTGETVDYTFKVTNTGTVTMNNVTVNDPKLVAAGLTV